MVWIDCEMTSFDPCINRIMGIAVSERSEPRKTTNAAEPKP
jgi:hypothetical protein